MAQILRGKSITSELSARNRRFSPAQVSRFYFNYHHTAADTFDKVDARELNENAALMNDSGLFPGRFS